MSTPADSKPCPPFEVYSVHFEFPGGDAIKLVDPATDQPITSWPATLGETPEWVITGRNELAAYVRNTRPRVRVVFRGDPGTQGTFTVGACGTLFRIEERQATLAFTAADGLSAPEIFQADRPLPDSVGLHAVNLEWYIQGAHESAPLPVATTTHHLCTSWRALTPNTGQSLYAWAYAPLMRWTCEWADGLDDPKEICDAILRDARRSGLRYGMPPRVTENVRELLRAGGGMCGDWCMVFQHMAHCQGVFVYRVAFAVDWRDPDEDGEVRWCALVIRNPGLNQDTPTHAESDFDDSETGYPTGLVTIVRRRERRYQFFGIPGGVEDGHCVNFLEHGGKLNLYDVCFRTESVEIDADLPVTDSTEAKGGADLVPFRRAYMDNAIDHMLGSLYNGDDFYECRVRDDGVRGGNGMTVGTRDIPESVGGEDGLTFFWVDV
jgi:hypothetical protein